MLITLCLNGTASVIILSDASSSGFIMDGEFTVRYDIILLMVIYRIWRIFIMCVL